MANPMFYDVSGLEPLHFKILVRRLVLASHKLSEASHCAARPAAARKLLCSAQLLWLALVESFSWFRVCSSFLRLQQLEGDELRSWKVRSGQVLDLTLRKFLRKSAPLSFQQLATWSFYLSRMIFLFFQDDFDFGGDDGEDNAKPGRSHKRFCYCILESDYYEMA